VTAVLDQTTTEPDTVHVSPDRLASWPARAGALTVDVLPGVGVIVTMALLALAAPPQGLLWWVFTVLAALSVLLMAVNRWVLPALTGWSLGRALFGIAVVRPDDSEAGMWRLLLRDLAHLLDTAALFVGWLWPLWDRRRRTFADLLLRTEVRRVERLQRGVRRPTAILLIAAAVLCAGGAGMGYLLVYRPDQAVGHARQQIAEQGPRIVEQLLTYDVNTLQNDFSHAQSLATDAYRPQLIAQQQAVQKAGATSNVYFAVSSAVLSVSQDRAAMLVAMQGQRGTDPKTLKFITATVRADFEKSGDGQWRVANLTVLKKPQLNQGGQ
jgi:Mce-associated membrane protein